MFPNKEVELTKCNVLLLSSCDNNLLSIMCSPSHCPLEQDHIEQS